MKTLAEEYCFKLLEEETKTGEITKTGLVASAVGGGAIGLGSYYFYKKYKQAQMKANAEKDPVKKNKLNVQANQLKQDASKKKVEDQKKQQIQKQQTIQKQSQINQ